MVFLNCKDESLNFDVMGLRFCDKLNEMIVMYEK